MIGFGEYDLLAIDPGNTQSGFVRIRDGLILESGVLPNEWMIEAVDGFARRFHKVRDDPRAFMCDPREQIVAIEQIRNMGMIVGQEVFDTVFFTGRLFERCEQHNIRAQLCPRIKIKTHLCGSARAKDANVRQALIDRWGAPGRKATPGPTYGISSHAWSALAVATFSIDNPGRV